MTGIISDNVGRTSGLIKSAGGGGGVWTLIKTLTASSDSTLSFVDGTADVVLDSTYPIYRFVWINAHPSTQEGDGNEFAFNLSADTGSNYNVAKTTTYYLGAHNENDAGGSTTIQSGHDLAQGTGVQNLCQDMDADNDASVSGELMLYNPSDTTYVKHFLAKSNYMHSAPMCGTTWVAGYGNTTSAVDALQFSFSGSATIESGTFKLYGIGDS